MADEVDRYRATSKMDVLDDSIRASSRPSDDENQDRRLILKKIQTRRRAARESKDEGDGGEGGRANLDRLESDIDEIDDYPPSPTYDEQDVLAARQSHLEDEHAMGGRLEDGGEENLDAMNQALTCPPKTWWSMRKQWQPKKFLGRGGRGAAHPDEIDDMNTGGLDASHRSAGGPGWAESGGGGVIGHPMMLEDPAAMGYNESSFRGSQTKDATRRGPGVRFVTREQLRQRKIQQWLYIIAALSAVFLFMFFLEQRKLTHYALTESPMSMSAYLAGDELMMTDEDRKKKLDLSGLGLEEFDRQHAQSVPEVAFGDIEVDPNDPLANDELANDPLVGNNPLNDYHNNIINMDRYELLRGVVVGWGITPDETFDNHNSPQYKALMWMADEDLLQYAPTNDHWIKKIVQRYALATLYFATNGVAWRRRAFFLSEKDECNWNEIFYRHFIGAGHCNGGFITALALYQNNLKGALPPEIGALTSLRTFSMFDNQLALTPPQSLANLKSLDRLFLQKNAFKNEDLSYLCPNNAWDFKADCGKRSNVICPCCSKCGLDAKIDKGWMMEDKIVPQ